jgi:uncharacterized protein YqfA (UPF0365 family)
MIVLGATAALIGIVFVLAVFIAGFVVISYIPMYIQARSSGVPVSIPHMIAMRLRRLEPRSMVEHLITLHKAGVEIPLNDLESHVLAGGNLPGVVSAAISAQKAGLGVGFRRICAIDLAGRYVVDAVNACVKPKVLVGDRISGVAKDGIRLGARVRVTVRPNLERLVGGANEETIMARVGEGTVSAIGSSDSHKEILESPEIICRYILDRGLDSGTAFEIVSVDVSDIDILDNIGARLREEQADADTKIGQARAESRRAFGAAQELEMRARVTEMRALETQAKAKVPLEMATAYSRGHIYRSPRPVKPVTQRYLWGFASE